MYVGVVDTPLLPIVKSITKTIPTTGYSISRDIGQYGLSDCYMHRKSKFKKGSVLGFLSNAENAIEKQAGRLTK